MLLPSPLSLPRVRGSLCCQSALFSDKETIEIWDSNTYQGIYVVHNLRQSNTHANTAQRQTASVASSSLCSHPSPRRSSVVCCCVVIQCRSCTTLRCCNRALIWATRRSTKRATGSTDRHKCSSDQTDFSSNGRISRRHKRACCLSLALQLQQPFAFSLFRLRPIVLTARYSFVLSAFFRTCDERCDPSMIRALGACMRRRKSTVRARAIDRNQTVSETLWWKE